MLDKGYSLSKNVSEIEFTYAQKFHSIQWENLMKEHIPSLNKGKRELVMAICGKLSLNPLVLITRLVLDDATDVSNADHSEEDFLNAINRLAKSLVTLDTKLMLSWKPKTPSG